MIDLNICVPIRTAAPEQKLNQDRLRRSCWLFCASLLHIFHMARFVAVACVVFAVITLACASNVVDLTPDNFDTYVDGSKAAFVEFFAPWYVKSLHNLG